jgi:hypothetical protein
MRFLVAGLVLILIGLTLTEYTRRNGAPSSETSSGDDAKPGGKKKPALPPKVAKLLELSAPDLSEGGAPAEATASLLASLKTEGPAVGGFSPLLSGDFHPRQLLASGFGYAVLAVDVGQGSALVRVESGTPAKALVTRARRITALTMDGSSLFFAEGSHVFATSARGETPLPRLGFKNAVVTSLAASGDDLVVTLMPADAADADGPVGAVVRIDAAGEVTLLAADQVRPRAVVTDGKEAFWLADGAWRAGLDGSFSSRLAEDAKEPLALDGDALVLGAKGELRRMSRAGGKQVTLAAADVAALVTSSGLVRYATAETPARLFEVTAGAEPTLVTPFNGPVSALALGGTTLFVLSTDAAGATLLAK